MIYRQIFETFADAVKHQRETVLAAFERGEVLRAVSIDWDKDFLSQTVHFASFVRTFDFEIQSQIPPV